MAAESTTRTMRRGTVEIAPLPGIVVQARELSKTNRTQAVALLDSAIPMLCPRDCLPAWSLRASIGVTSLKELDKAEKLLKKENGFSDPEILWWQTDLSKYRARIHRETKNFEETLQCYTRGSMVHEGFALDAIEFFQDCKRDLIKLKQSWEEEKGEPKSLSAYKRFLLAHENDLPDPLPFCEEALQHNRSIPLIFARANSYYFSKKWSQAKDDYLVLLERKEPSPYELKIRDRLAICFIRLGDSFLAMPHLNKAFKLDSNPFTLIRRSTELHTFRLNQAFFLSIDLIEKAFHLIDKNPEQALRLFTEALESGHFFRAMVGRVMSLIKLNRIPAARSDLEALLQGDDLNDTERVEALKILADISSSDAAQRCFEEAWGLDKSVIAVKYITFLIDHKNFSKALEYCAIAAADEALEWTDFFYLKARVHSIQEEWLQLEQACFEFFVQKNIREYPHYREMLLFAIGAHQKLQHYGPLYSRMLDLDDLEIPSNYFERREELREIHKEVATSNHLRELIENLVTDRYNLSSDSKKIGYLSAFLTTYKDFFPKHIVHQVNALSLRGELFLKEKRFEEAKKDFAEIKKIVEDFPYLFHPGLPSLIESRITRAEEQNPLPEDFKLQLLVQTSSSYPVL